MEIPVFYPCFLFCLAEKKLWIYVIKALDLDDNSSLVATMKDLKAQMQEQQARLDRQDKSVQARFDRQEKSVKARIDGLDSKAMELIKKVSALDHKYVSVAGVTEVLKTNQLETEKWLLSSMTMSQKPARLENNLNFL